MTDVLLALLVVEFAVLIGVYAIPEKRSANHYRTEHLSYRDDELVYRDLLARVVMRNGRHPVLTSSRAQESAADEQTREKVSDGFHGSFPGWDR